MTIMIVLVSDEHGDGHDADGTPPHKWEALGSVHVPLMMYVGTHLLPFVVWHTVGAV